MKRAFIGVFGSLVLTLSAFCQPATVAPPNPVESAIITQLVGAWTNQLQSTLLITSIDATTGQVSGSYRSPSGTTGTDYPLVGWVNTPPPSSKHTNNATVVSFSVRWGTIGSVTTWNGTYTANGDGPVITGQWLLSRPNTDFSWDHILAGQDQFHRK